jgi:hypothetical protein
VRVCVCAYVCACLSFSLSCVCDVETPLEQEHLSPMMDIQHTKRLLGYQPQDG